MNDRVLLQLDQTTRQLAHAVERNTATLLSSMQQHWTLAQLQARYSLGRDAMLAALGKHTGYVPARGKSVRVALRDVLRLDQVLET